MRQVTGAPPECWAWCLRRLCSRSDCRCRYSPRQARRVAVRPAPGRMQPDGGAACPRPNGAGSQTLLHWRCARIQASGRGQVARRVNELCGPAALAGGGQGGIREHPPADAGGTWRRGQDPPRPARSRRPPADRARRRLVHRPCRSRRSSSGCQGGNHQPGSGGQVRTVANLAPGRPPRLPRSASDPRQLRASPGRHRRPGRCRLEGSRRSSPPCHQPPTVGHLR